MFGRHHGIGLEGDHAHDSLGGEGIVPRRRFVRGVSDELSAFVRRGRVLGGRDGVSGGFGGGDLDAQQGV